MTDDRTPVEQAQAARKALLDAYYVTFTSEDGRRVLEDLRASAFFSRTTMHQDQAGRADPHRTLYNEGARALVIAIERKVHEARQGQVEPTQTHAVSSTATQEP